MNKLLCYVILGGVLSFNALAQATIGTIVFANRQIPTSAGDGTTYNVPLFANDGSHIEGGIAFGNPDSTAPAGQIPGGVTVGLFTAQSATPFATAVLRTDANGMYFQSVNGGGSSAPVDVPGSTAGQQVPLTVRAWTTAMAALMRRRSHMAYNGVNGHSQASRSVALPQAAVCRLRTLV